MSQAKRYYWLKLKDDFFDSLGIKKLRRKENGDAYTVIYLKMLLKSICSDGTLTYTGVEEDFIGELALDIDEDEETVREAMGCLVACKLVERPDNEHVHLPYAVENTGSESDSAQRKRVYRNEQKSGQCPTSVPQVSGQCPPEKEKDIRDRERERPGAQAREAMEEFCRMREQRGKPLSAADERSLIARLEKMSSAESVQAAILRQSVRKRWLDIYPLGKDTAVRTDPEESSLDMEALEEELMRYRPNVRDFMNAEEGKGSEGNADGM